MSNFDIKGNFTDRPLKDGRTVPDGYFDDFARRMMAQLPETSVAAAQPKRTVWQKIRPYVYMAAMFAGVYLMMNIFTLTTGLNRQGNNPDNSMIFADLMNTGTQNYVDEYVAMADPYLYDDLYESGFEIPENL